MEGSIKDLADIRFEKACRGNSTFQSIRFENRKDGFQVFGIYQKGFLL